MQVLIVSKDSSWVAEARSTTAALFEASAQMAGSGIKPVPKLTVFPGKLKASYIDTITKNDSSHVYTCMFHNRLIDVVFDLQDGQLVNPNAWLEDDTVSLQLIAADGQLTAYAQHFGA